MNSAMNKHVPELLCPAGSFDAAKAALANGADALYLGAASFGARASAGFDEKALGEVIDLCHFYGKAVYVTVNTLVKEKELKGVRNTLKILENLRADAVLVQDMGVLDLIRTEFPNLCVHASTQMSLHNAVGAELLKSLGVQRVVLARECALDAIRAVAQTGVETEVFVHGAQCVCVSGQCRFSGLIGGRSGNRGRCAQPCRLPYEWNGQTKMWLSPRDICLRDQVKALSDAGVASLKVEGRLKRPEYVAVVTRAYRDALDALAEGCFKPAGESEKEAMSQVFSRTFFPGYAGGAQDAEIMNPERVSSNGIMLGTVTRAWKKGTLPLCEVKVMKTLNNGDGLQIRGFKDQDIIYSGAEVPKGQTATLRLHFPVRAGDSVVRIDDEHQLKEARQSYEGKDALPRLPFDAVLTVVPGENAALTVSDDRAEVTVYGDVVQTAQSAPLDESRARRAIEKTGDTGYALRGLTVLGENAYLTPAALNELRRTALEKLKKARVNAYLLPQAGRIAPLSEAKNEKTAPKLYAQCSDHKWIAVLKAAGADEVLFAPLDVTKAALERTFAALPAGTRVVLPVQLTDNELSRLRDKAPKYALRLCAGSVGQLAGDMLLSEGVPVWNSRAADLLSRLGGKEMVLPRELSAGEVEDLKKAAPAGDFILPVYGRARLMYLNHCPARTELKLKSGRENCRLCEEGKGCLGRALTDRRGESFPLLPLRLDAGCLVQLLSCRVRSLNDRADRSLSWLLDFTLESLDEALAVIRAYRRMLDGKGTEMISGSHERFDAGVE